MSLVGIVGGVIAATLLTRVMASLLYDVRPTDPPTLAIAALGLTCAALTRRWCQRFEQHWPAPTFDRPLASRGRTGSGDEQLGLVLIVCAAAELDVVDGRASTRSERPDMVELDERRLQYTNSDENP